MEEYIRVTAKTVEDAIIEASIQLGTSSDNVEYKIIERETKGFLGIGAKKAVIEAKKKKTDEAMEKARQEAEERATENVKKQIAEADEERAAAIERAERLAKELKTKEDTDTAACALYIDEVKGLLNKLAERVASAKEKEPEQGKKLAGAVIRVLDAMKAPFEEIAGGKAECEQE